MFHFNYLWLKYRHYTGWSVSLVSVGWSVKTFSYQVITLDDMTFLNPFLSPPDPPHPFLCFYVLFIVFEYLCFWSRELFCTWNFLIPSLLLLLSCQVWSTTVLVRHLSPCLTPGSDQCAKRFTDLLKQPFKEVTLLWEQVGSKDLQQRLPTSVLGLQRIQSPLLPHSVVTVQASCAMLLQRTKYVQNTILLF